MRGGLSDPSHWVLASRVLLIWTRRPSRCSPWITLWPQELSAPFTLIFSRTVIGGSKCEPHYNYPEERKVQPQEMLALFALCSALPVISGGKFETDYSFTERRQMHNLLLLRVISLPIGV